MAEKSKPTARDYVESYINENDDLTNDFLKQQQPRYDPTKPLDTPKQQQKEEQEESKLDPNVLASEHYKVHLRTVNPIPSQEQATKTNEQQQQDQEQEQGPEVVWTSRDIKHQRNEIHDTSLAICGELHDNLLSCFTNGSWWDKAKMCEEQKQKFWLCYNTQKKFLKQVNYKGPVNTQKQDDRILLHAYKLYDKQQQDQPPV
ncbi:hypothetical protein K501DRAFT_240922 [Backusella circina FSU 941]|nr:hypothetical protein K501DRAFT_240922 [Backusella circina FSU 941]